jgi:hypothetical protein
MHLKPRLDPYLHARGLEWADVVQVLETIDSIEELRAAADDPEALLEGYFPLEVEENKNEGLHYHRKTGGDDAGRQLVLPASGGDANSLPANKDSTFCRPKGDSGVVSSPPSSAPRALGYQVRPLAITPCG